MILNHEQLYPAPDTKLEQVDPSQQSPSRPSTKLRHCDPGERHVDILGAGVGVDEAQLKPTPGTNSEQSEDPSQHSPRAPLAKLRQVAPVAKHVPIVVVVVVVSDSACSKDEQANPTPET